MIPLSSISCIRSLHQSQSARLPLLLAVVGLTLLLTACGSSKPLSRQHIFYSPNPLMLNNGHLDVDLTVHIPSKYVGRNALVTLTPCLFWNDEGLLGDSMTVQGERVEGMQQIISHKRGGVVHLSSSFPYREGIEEAALVLYVQSKVGEQVTDCAVPIDSGVNCTQALLERAIDELGPQGRTDINVQAGLKALQQNRTTVAAVKFDLVGGNCAFIANILAQNYAQASVQRAKLNPAQPLTAYLTALLGVRMEDEALLRQGLQALATSKDATLQHRIKHDLEFKNVKSIIDEIIP